MYKGWNESFRNKIRNIIIIINNNMCKESFCGNYLLHIFIVYNYFLLNLLKNSDKISGIKVKVYIKISLLIFFIRYITLMFLEFAIVQGICIC